VRLEAEQAKFARQALSESVDPPRELVVLTKKQAPLMGACSCIEAYKLLLKSGHATAASTEAEHTHQA